MTDLKYIITISRRHMEELNLHICRECGISTVHNNLCHGTASQSMLDYLGIEDTEKYMLTMMADSETVEKYRRALIHKFGISAPGTGISLTIPVESIGGMSSFMHLTGKQEFSSGKVENMEETKYSLIVVISEGGQSDLVMDAARSAGARGGTVVSSKGTGAEFTSKFFGVSIASEKDIIYIVSKRSGKDEIMRAIIEKAGAKTPAHAAVFSLPVEDVIGLESVLGDD